MSAEHELESLLDLDGLRYLIDEYLGLWVKLDAKRVVPSLHRPQGIKYSFSLHNKENQRLMGFDNAHAIETKYKIYDHWHQHAKDEGQYYAFTTPAQLIEDFW